MPFDDAVTSMIRRKRFWTDYYFLTESPGPKFEDLDDPEFDPLKVVVHEIEFRCSKTSSLILDFDEDLIRIALSLKCSGSRKPIDLGYADLAHPFQHVLRWEELQLICRCICKADKTMKYPGVALLMLFPFAPITVDDDLEAIRSTLTEAWVSLNLFSVSRIERLVGRTCRPLTASWRWIWSSAREGWILDDTKPRFEKDAFGARHEGNDDFPFSVVERFFQEIQRLAKRKK